MKSGFTLVEMLVVIAIIAILTAASTASYNGVRKHGWRTRDRATAMQIATAWNVYLQEERSFKNAKLSSSSPYDTTEDNLYSIAPYVRDGDDWVKESGKTLYLEISGEELDRGRSLDVNDGGLFDHWKHRFHFTLDGLDDNGDYDGKVLHPDPRLKGDSRKRNGCAMVWSTCNDKDAGPFAGNPDRWAVCWQ